MKSRNYICPFTTLDCTVKLTLAVLFVIHTDTKYTCTNEWFKVFISSVQPLHSVQWDCEYLEPSVGLPSLLLCRRVQHGLGPSSHRRLQRGLRHLLHRTLLLPGAGLDFFFSVYFICDRFKCLVWMSTFYFESLVGLAAWYYWLMYSKMLFRLHLKMQQTAQ